MSKADGEVRIKVNLDSNEVDKDIEKLQKKLKEQTASLQKQEGEVDKLSEKYNKLVHSLGQKIDEKAVSLGIDKIKEKMAELTNFKHGLSIVPRPDTKAIADTEKEIRNLQYAMAEIKEKAAADESFSDLKNSISKVKKELDLAIESQKAWTSGQVRTYEINKNIAELQKTLTDQISGFRNQEGEVDKLSEKYNKLVHSLGQKIDEKAVSLGIDKIKEKIAEFTDFKEQLSLVPKPDTRAISDTEKEIRNLQNAVAEMKEKAAGDEAFSGLKNSIEEMRKEVELAVQSQKAWEEQINKTQTAIKNLENQKRGASENKIAEAQIKAQEVQRKIQEEAQRKAQAEAQRILKSTESFRIRVEKQDLESLQNAFNKIKNSLNSAKNSLENLKNLMGKAGPSDVGSGAFKGIKEGMQSSESEAQGLGQKIGDVFGNLGRKVEGFGSRIFRLASSAFVFNVISSGFREMASGIQTVIAQDNALSSSLSTVSSNLFTAFYPIYQAILPALRALGQGLAWVTGQIAAFIAMLTGTSVKANQLGAQMMVPKIGGDSGKISKSAKALGDQAKGYDKVGKAAQKAKGELASFDKIEVLRQNHEKNQKTPKASGGSGSGGVGAGFAKFVDMDT